MAGRAATLLHTEKGQFKHFLHLLSHETPRDCHPLFLM